MQHEVYLVSVFAAASNGGNMAPIVPDALGMSDSDMQEVARKYGHECGFVLPAPAGSGCDYELRFWVPNHVRTCNSGSSLVAASAGQTVQT